MLIRDDEKGSAMGFRGGWPKWLLIGLLSAVAASQTVHKGWAQKITVRMKVRGHQIEGAPLSWSGRTIALLGRDGGLLQFPSHEAEDFRKVSSRFSSYTAGQLRSRLAREFGRGFEVSGAGRYLVVHPAGQRDQWAKRFEQLHRSFQHYFTARGVRLKRPRFPLVAVVFHNRADFARFAAKDGAPTTNVLGYYSPISNRVIMFDASGGSNPDWELNAETIIHEAAHQSAYNTGLHNRFCSAPRWLVEGLGTMFEAKGVWNSRHHPHLKDRVNAARLKEFVRLAPNRPQGRLSQLIASDRLFRTRPSTAYTESWAISFYLAEKHPRKYAKFLAKTAARPSFQDYRPQERTADFVESFGKDLMMLESRMLRFITSLPQLFLKFF